jgi:hypothetical protein
MRRIVVAIVIVNAAAVAVDVAIATDLCKSSNPRT